MGLLVVAAAVRIVTGSDCPSGAAIEERLGQLLPQGGASVAHVAEVTETGEGILVVLRAWNGQVLGERLFVRGHGCSELAAAIAITIATWESDIHPAFTAALPEAAVVSPPQERRPLVTSWQVGGGVGGQSSGSSESAGWIAEVVATAMAGRTGVGIRFAGDSGRELALASGRVRWSRLLVGFGPRVQIVRPTPDVYLDFGGELVAARFAAHGLGFGGDRSHSAFDPGAAADARLSWRQGALFGWAGVGMNAWPTTHRLKVAPTDAARDVPRWDVTIRVGFGFCSIPR